MSRKRAFVTGASEGLGRTFVKKLAQEGYDTTSVARNEDRLKDLMSDLASGECVGQHNYFVADLNTDEGIESCAEYLRAHRFDLLVNNAGFSRFGDFVESPIELEKSILKVNCQAVMILAHAYLASARPGDALINLSSVANFLPTPIQPSYVATKCFVASLSESLWYQQRKKGVYVQGLCPGLTKTQFIDRAYTGNRKGLLDFFSNDPAMVIDTSLRALSKRKGPIVITGFWNRLLVFSISLLPRNALVYLSGKINDLS
jgi:short-subunit dehydrogenase